MVDTRTTTGNDNDDWEVAVDTGEFDKRLEQLEKDRAATQESVLPTIVNDDDNRNYPNINVMQSNKPIRILKRPTSQSQLPITNDVPISNSTATTIVSNNNNSLLSNNISSSTTVPVISIIPRNQSKDSLNSSQLINFPTFSSASQSAKPPIKTYEQREQEYRLARLRIMGEEESSAKDDDDIISIEPTPTTSDESTSTKTLPQTQSTLDSYASHLYTLTDRSSIHFTPNINSTGPFSQQQQQHYRGAYSQMPLPPRYPTTSTDTIYMTSTSNYPSQQSSNDFYNYQQQTPYGTQQFGQPQ